MVILGWLAQVEHTQRAIASGTYVTPLENFLFVTSVLSIVAFGFLVGVAVYLRRSPEAHKRLLICATITLVFPAVGRLPGALAFGPLAPLVFTNALLIPLIGYDIVTRRRLHAATVWGSAAALSLLVIASTPLAATNAVDRFIRWIAV